MTKLSKTMQEEYDKMVHESTRMEWVYDDGGRSRYFKAEHVGDCVCRAVAIATGRDYKEVYDDINRLAKSERTGKRKRGKSSARDGVYKGTIRKLMAEYGWEWVPTMQVGQGCRVHLRADELPSGPLVVSVSGHLTAVVDGRVRDTHDPSRGGTRCVYGYFRPPAKPTRHEGHGSARLFREQMEALTDDFTAGLLAWSEYGQQAERFAREYSGWSE